MALLNTFEKQPADVLDYDVDYSEWLPANDAVASATVVVTPSGGLTVNTYVITQAGTRVKLWVSGGTADVTYKVEVTATTVLGRVKQDEVRFRIKEY